MLSDTNKQAIVQQIITGKVKNAVQAPKFINSIVISPVFSQTVRNTLKEASLKAVVKKKKPLLWSTIRREDLPLLSSINIGLWRIGKGLYGQMRLKSIGLGQMDKSMYGKRREKG